MNGRVFVDNQSSGEERRAIGKAEGNANDAVDIEMLGDKIGGDGLENVEYW